MIHTENTYSLAKDANLHFIVINIAKKKIGILTSDGVNFQMKEFLLSECNSIFKELTAILPLNIKQRYYLCFSNTVQMRY